MAQLVLGDFRILQHIEAKLCWALYRKPSPAFPIVEGPFCFDCLLYWLLPYTAVVLQNISFKLLCCPQLNAHTPGTCAVMGNEGSGNLGSSFESAFDCHGTLRSYIQNLQNLVIRPDSFRARPSFHFLQLHGHGRSQRMRHPLDKLGLHVLLMLDSEALYGCSMIPLL